MALGGSLPTSPARAGSTAGACSRRSAGRPRGWGRSTISRRGARRRPRRLAFITAVVLADGSRIACGTLANCAGAGARALAATGGGGAPGLRRAGATSLYLRLQGGRPELPAADRHAPASTCAPRARARRGGASSAASRRMRRRTEGLAWRDEGCGDAGRWTGRISRSGSGRRFRGAGARLRGDPPRRRLGRPLRHVRARPESRSSAPPRAAGARELFLLWQGFFRPRPAAEPPPSGRRPRGGLIAQGRYTTLDSPISPSRASPRAARGGAQHSLSVARPPGGFPIRRPDRCRIATKGAGERGARDHGEGRPQ